MTLGIPRLEVNWWKQKKVTDRLTYTPKTYLPLQLTTLLIRLRPLIDLIYGLPLATLRAQGECCIRPQALQALGIHDGVPAKILLCVRGIGYCLVRHLFYLG